MSNTGPGQPSAPGDAPFRFRDAIDDAIDDLHSLINPPPGQLVAVAACALDGHPLLAARADEPFYAASTMKIAVQVAVERAVELDQISAEDIVEVRTTFTSTTGETYELDADDRDPDLATNGETTTVRNLLDRMITTSSNEATNLLIAHLGASGHPPLTPTDTEAVRRGVAAAADAMRLLGATGSRLERPIGDQHAQRQGRTNLVTAADLATGLARLASGRIAGLSAETIDRIIETLTRQTHGEGIAAALPPNTRWAAKNGWMNDIRHDAAIVWPADAPPYTLAICTRGLESGTPPAADPETEENPAILMIRDISRRVYAANARRTESTTPSQPIGGE